MREQRFNFDSSFRLLIIVGLSISLAMPLIGGFGYRGPGFWISLLFTLFVTAFYYILQRYPVSALIFPLIFLFFCLVYFRNPLLFTERVAALFSLEQPADALFWPLIIIALAVLINYLVIFKADKPLPLLFGTGLITTSVLWYLYIDSAYPATITYSLFWLMLLSYNRGVAQWSGKTVAEKTDCLLEGVRNSWLSYTLMVILLAALGTLILPKNIAPLPWPALQNWTAENFSFLQNLRPVETPLTRGDGGEFSLYSFDLQSEKDLGGPLNLDEIILLEFRGKGKTYLRGSIMDSYTGRSWNDTTIFYAVNNLPRPPEDLVNYLTENMITIKHLRLNTSTLFSGLYPQEIFAPPGLVLVNSGSGLKFERSVPLNYEYRVKSYHLAFQPDFVQLESAEKHLFFKTYLELPKEMPYRIRQLAREIIAAEESSYDKIKALENYLRQNYKYETDTPLTPQGRDFVDYFLFDLLEGYCTYFASALAVLGRAAGIPTRLVSGFVVPALPNATGSYYIAGTDAHAWVEAYISGVGWLPFEATPGFSTDDTLPIRSSDPYLSYFSGTELEDGRAINPRGTRDFDPDRNGEASGAGPTIMVTIIIRWLLIVIILSGLILSAGLIMILLFRFRMIKMKLEQLNRLSPSHQAVGYYNLTLSLLERLALGKKPGETPQEHSRRINREVHLWNLDFRAISSGVSMALYSKQPVPPRLAHEASQFFQVIFDRYLANYGRINAVVEILIRGRYFLKGLP